MSLIRADAINIPLQDGTVDLVVTSPPYFSLRSYTDGGEHYDGQIGSEPTPQDFLEALWAVTAECARVLKPSGSIWVNLGDKYSGSSGQNNNGKGSSTLNGHGGEGTAKDQGTKAAPVKVETSIPAKSLMGLPWRYAIGCIDQLGLILRAEVIWSKPNGLPESVTDRVRRSHEQWFHFTKEPRYYAAVDEVREAHADPERGMSGKSNGTTKQRAGRDEGGYTAMGWQASTLAFNPLGKLPGSVWTIPSEPLKVPDHLGVDHFAAYPQEWPRRIILGWSPPKVCRDCGCPLVQSDDGTSTTAVRGVRPTDHGLGHETEGLTDPSGQQEPLLWEGVRQQGDGSQALDDAGMGADHEGVHRYARPGSPDGGQDRLRDAAPGDDGGAPGQSPDRGRGRPPQERRPVGQQDRELGSDAEADPRQDVGLDEAAPDRVPILRSRGSGYEVCSRCGSAEVAPSVILDPFGGTGTTAMVARALGRYPVHMDLSADYLRLAQWRIYESGHAAKTVNRTNGERRGAGRGDLVNLPAVASADQLDLFGGAA